MPEGWLRSHRKDWYKRHLGLRYSSRQPSFRASENVSRQKRVTGIDGPTVHPPSFPQPDDAAIEEEEESAAGAEQDQGASPDITSAIEIPRASNPNEEVPQRDRPSVEDKTIGEGVQSLDGTESGKDARKSPGAAVGDQTQSKDVTNPQRPEQHAKSTEVGASVDLTKVQTSNSPVSSNEDSHAASQNRVSSVPSQYGVKSITASEQPGPSTSTSALIPQPPEPDPKADAKLDSQERPSSGPTAIISKVKRSIGKPSDEAEAAGQDGANLSAEQPRKKSQIHFNLPIENVRDQLILKARMAQLDLQRAPSRLLSLKRRLTDGQIFKTERMLVRVETTRQTKLPDDYDENSSQGVTTETAEPFREYMVVCRQSGKTEGADFVLQMYRTRVIPAIDASESRTHATHIVPLGRKIAHVNLYSSLDKTVALWVPQARGTEIYILRPRTSANSVEWYTFLRNILGWHRPSEIQVNVPDFSISLRIANPFKDLEVFPDEDEEAENEEELKRAMDEEQLAATKIIQQCLNMLEASPEWKDVLQAWAKGQRIGLAWKRYDRLEWIHGANERKMYGTMAMMKSHDLELRPKEHYPTSTPMHKERHQTEPAPVEGFLIRLTSKKGLQQRMGKMFYKRLYFSTYDHYLLFSRPAKADPPPPPRIPSTDGKKIPNVHQIAESIPIIYSVNPYPVENNQIQWLIPGRVESHDKQHRDEDAFDEVTRKVHNVFACDGFIDLVNVVRVRHMRRGATPADETIDEGSDVDYDIEVPNQRADDGKTDQIDDRRTFELVLNNGLVIRLQAFDEETKKEWIRRLRELVRYWKYRHAADMDLYRAVRRQNLDQLQIDEEAEAIVGQYARKWEVTKTYASPELYNMCGISCCRTIHLSGPLYRKPKRHSLFAAVHCVLIPGTLLLFSATLRSHSGRSIPHIHSEKMDSIDLKDCYLYSGLLTENDLLYQNQTFDANNPGHHALPRMWLEDAWTSRDEDYMTTFVVWQPRSKGWFRQPKALGERNVEEKMKTKLRRVANLGKKGRTIVFKARSRAERDHWVLAIGTEIERLHGDEDVRIVTEKEKKRKKERDG